MLQISIAQRQMKAKIHSFPTMYILGGGRCGRNGSNQGFRPKIRPKTRFFGGHKYWLSHFRVTWDAQFLSWRQFRCVPRKVWVKTFKMSYGHVQYLRNCPNAGLLHYFSERTRKMGKNGFFKRTSFHISANYSNAELKGTVCQIDWWNWRSTGVNMHFLELKLN